ncbi:MAG: DNA primase [Acholeplasmataceae bacterium]|nr:MAG: DNA primase [Acholeplasmataceae bacterium]
MIDTKLLETINEKTDIVDLVSQFVDLAKRGKNYMGLCPFHKEKTPSFSVSPEKNIAKCMACGEGGTPINFYRKIKNIPFEEAAYALAEKAGIEIKTTKTKKDPHEHHYKLMNEVASFYQFNLKNSTTGQTALQYLRNRQMTDDLVDHFRLGYAPVHGDALYQLLKDKGYAVSDMISLGVVKQDDKGRYYDLFSDRIIFPITNPRGHVVGLSGRTLDPKDQVKYINSPETPIFRKGFLLYHYHEALGDIRRNRNVILCEGFFDVISSYAAGVKNAVATMGTALTREQARLIQQATSSIIVAFDGDTAGLKAADQAIPVLVQNGLKTEVLKIPEKMDPDDFIRSYGSEAYEALFGEYTQDAYAFRYDLYRSGKNLKNANDIETFKKQVTGMLRGADVAIQSFYKNKLAKLLNIDAEAIKIASPPARMSEPVIPRKSEPARILNRYERAERDLIFAMMRSKPIARHVKSKLKATDFADPLIAELRIRIESYYEHVDIFDLGQFLERLNKEQRDLMTNVLLKDPLSQFQFEDQPADIDHYIKLVKLANDHRRLHYLNQKIADGDGDQLDKFVIERDQIRQRLKASNAQYQ